ncbi:trypsin-like peptidase domain-containing protein [Sporosarcina jeotgali]|uniref:Trypsin-like peptidase domain-containing protein n=1 Tax=Sporosarcina jeotgali TaxID=3020056 RepID=A0ABZ0KZY3_9BACL|nr:trypsin-like peptidase domain-containing protein [Sporosarcina sp. B2O-1]WOV84897.1 trypsin-like peptidase domain-containing protein [Sporosarcina sp. B2O-1]
MFCPHCGTQNDEGSKFCSNCGKPLKTKKQNSWMLPVALSSMIVLLGSIAGIGYVADWNYGKLLHLSDDASPAPIKEVIVEKEKPLKPISSQQIKTKTVKPDKEKTEVIKESLPRVFTIFTRDGLGSGFLYKKGGLIVTNAHVVAGFTDVVVRNSDGKDAAGKVIGISDRYDVALIRADAFSNLPPLGMESKETPIGTEVIALGSPQGFENSASVGYLTGLNRDMELGFVYEKIYQIDAQIDKGSSGGPLLDAKTGKVIGINSLLYKENNLFGFSIPMHSVISLVDRWASSPMSEIAIASLFGVYDTYTASHDYDSDIAYDDEYTEFYEVEEEDEVVPDDLYDEDSSYEGGFYEENLRDFMTSFREEYEMSIQAGDSTFLMSYLLPGAPTTREFQTFIQEVASDGRIYQFFSTDITDITIQANQALVTLDLSYSVSDSAGEENYIEKSKTYTIVMDAEGYYQISNVIDN